MCFSSTSSSTVASTVAVARLGLRKVDVTVLGLVGVLDFVVPAEVVSIYIFFRC